MVATCVLDLRYLSDRMRSIEVSGGRLGTRLADHELRLVRTALEGYLVESANRNGALRTVARQPLPVSKRSSGSRCGRRLGAWCAV